MRKAVISKLANKITKEYLSSIKEDKIAKELMAKFYFKHDPFHKTKPNGRGWIRTDKGWVQVDWTKIAIHIYKNVNKPTMGDVSFLMGFFGLPKEIAIALFDEYDRRKISDTVGMKDTRVRAINELIEEFEHKEEVFV